MKKIFLFLFLSTINIMPIFGEQNLLQRVKNNPNEAIKLCEKLKDFNAKDILASDDVVIKEVAKKKGLDQLNAEIYIVYAIGLHCPQVK